MISAFKKNYKLIIKILLLLNLLLLIFFFLFFDYYKKRKINQYNELNKIKNKDIQSIEKEFSDYYHKFNNFIFHQEDRKIIKSKNDKKYD